MNELERSEEFIAAIQKGLGKTIVVDESVEAAQQGSLNLVFSKGGSKMRIDQVEFMYDKKAKDARQVKNVVAYVKNFFDGVKILSRVDAAETFIGMKGNGDELISEQEVEERKDPLEKEKTP